MVKDYSNVSSRVAVAKYVTHRASQMMVSIFIAPVYVIEGSLVFAGFRVDDRVGRLQIHESMIPVQSLSELVLRHDKPIMIEFVH
jgi:hypothetical protein